MFITIVQHPAHSMSSLRWRLSSEYNRLQQYQPHRQHQNGNVLKYFIIWSFNSDWTKRASIAGVLRHVDKLLFQRRSSAMWIVRTGIPLDPSERRLYSFRFVRTKCGYFSRNQFPSFIIIVDRVCPRYRSPTNLRVHLSGYGSHEPHEEDSFHDEGDENTKDGNSRWTKNASADKRTQIGGRVNGQNHRAERGLAGKLHQRCLHHLILGFLLLGVSGDRTRGKTQQAAVVWRSNRL